MTGKLKRPLVLGLGNHTDGGAADAVGIRAIILDAIHTGRAAPGTIVELNPDSLAPVAALGGLPEIFTLARRLKTDFPQELDIFAVEVKDYLTVGGAMSPAVRQAVPALVERVRQQVEHWKQGSAKTNGSRLNNCHPDQNTCPANHPHGPKMVA